MATVVLVMEVRQTHTDTHALSAPLLSLTSPSLSLSLYPCLIFIIKILFLISMDFLPRAAMAMTPLTRAYNVLNIQIKIFSLSSFLRHAKLFLQSSTKASPAHTLCFPPSLPSTTAGPGLGKHKFLCRCS